MLVGPNTRLRGCVSLSMGEWLTLQFSVAAFAGMALAMIVPPVRRSVPRWMEAFIWLGLIVTCWLAITNVQHTNTRFLTESIAWGANQIVNTSVGLMIGGIFSWISDHRFVIANALVTLVGADILLLALLRSHRELVGLAAVNFLKLPCRCRTRWMNGTGEPSARPRCLGRQSSRGWSS